MAIIMALLAGAGSIPTWNLAGEAGVWALAAALLICLPCALLSLIPMGYVLVKGMKDWWVQAAVATMALRMFTTLAAAFLAAWLLPVPTVVFLVWLLLFYAALLVWETALVIRIVNTEDQTPPEASGFVSPRTGGIVS